MSDAVAVVEKEVVQEAQMNASNFLEAARKIAVITNDDEYMAASTFRQERGLKAKRFIDEKFDPIIDKAKEAKKAAEASRKAAADLKDEVMAPIAEGIKLIETSMKSYHEEAERKRREEEERLRKEALRKAEEERLAQAEALENAGEAELADKVLEEPVQAAPLPKMPPPLAKGGVRTYYSARVVDLMVLVKAVAAGQVPMAAIQANQPYLNNRATHDKEFFNIPGVEVLKK